MSETLRRKLFLSFEKIMRLMKDGALSEDDLNNGIYYFDYSEDYIAHPLQCGYEGPFNRANHQLLMRAVQRANAFVRVKYRPRTHNRTLHELNQIVMHEEFGDGRKLETPLDAQNFREGIDHMRFYCDVIE